LVVGNVGAISSAESDVTNTDGDGVCTEGSGLGVFADSEEVVESNVAEIGCGTLLGALLWVVPGLLEEVFREGDGDS